MPKEPHPCGECRSYNANVTQAAPTEGTDNAQQDTPELRTSWTELNRLQVPTKTKLRIEMFMRERGIRHQAEARRILLERALQAEGY